MDAAKAVGAAVANKALAKGITEVVLIVTVTNTTESSCFG